MRPVARLQGMSDLSRGSWLRKQRMQERLAEFIASHGYGSLETPVLEPTELFLRKSGGELASRIYSFTDPGSNTVSLRPEFTASIMRYYLERNDSIDLPIRWQYTGPVFRYDDTSQTGKDGRDGSRGSGQFTQVGAELLGASSVLADAELLILAARLPAHLGITGCWLELGNLEVLQSALQAAHLSERARGFIIENIPRLRSGPEEAALVLQRAAKLHLTASTPNESYLALAVAGLDEPQAWMVLRGLLQWTSVNQLGQRNPEEVIDRLLRKLKGSDDPTQLERGVEVATRLAGIRGQPEASLKAAQEVLQDAGASLDALTRLTELLELVQTEPALSGHLVLDFGLVRGLAYYNASIFQVNHPAWPEPLGGGGRYDGLARALGSDQPLPALGFAYTLETLLALTESKDILPPEPALTLVLPADTASYLSALQVAGELRQQGYITELDVSGFTLEQALSGATRANNKPAISRIIVVDREGERTTHHVQQ